MSTVIGGKPRSPINGSTSILKATTTSRIAKSIAYRSGTPRRRTTIMWASPQVVHTNSSLMIAEKHGVSLPTAQPTMQPNYSTNYFLMPVSELSNGTFAGVDANPTTTFPYPSSPNGA
jgi:hypothetical protein